MNLISIKPCDNTFFGDGNQFNFDISNIVKSKNMPYSSVFFGAIFTAILTQNDDFREVFFEKNNYDHEKILKIGNIYLLDEEKSKVYIKAPMDLFMQSKGEKAFGKFEKVDKEFKSLKYDRVLYCPEDKNYVRATSKYININNIYDAYLKEQAIRIELKDEEQIFTKNYKVGIGMDKSTRTTEEGKLYKIEQTEFADSKWCYAVEYEIDKKYIKKSPDYNKINLKELRSGYLKLGGENKVCRFHQIHNEDIEAFNSLKIKEIKNNIFKLLFISDSYFKESIEKVFENIGLRIIGIANDKPIYIGGYDMKGKEKGKIREMYKGYPAGTVLLLEIMNDKVLVLKSIEEEMKNSKGFNRYIVMGGGI